MTNTPTLNFSPNRRRTLTENEWSAAWDQFLVVYTIKFPDQLPDLISYAQTIRSLMKTGQNWAMYDTQYRMDREYSHCPWTALRVDLQLAAQHFPQQQRQPRYTPNFRPNPQPNFRPYSQRLPNGYCIKYHTRNETCPHSDACRYNHHCPKCHRNHPTFMCYSTTTRPKNITPKQTQTKNTNANPTTNSNNTYQGRPTK